MTKIIIQNVRVFDSERLLDSSNVIFTRSASNIQDPMGEGSEAETSDVVVDGRGCTLVPGLIDVYANIKGANAYLSEFAVHGVTTVIDLSSSTQQCQALRVYTAGRTKLPTVLTSGTEAAPVHEHQPQLYDNPDEAAIRTKEDAVAFVAAKASGPDRADFVKVVVDLDSPNDALLKAIVDTAHAHGKLTIARTVGKSSYNRAMRAGFDIFAHAPLDAPLDTELAREMAAQNKVFVPTLLMMKKRTGSGSRQDSSQSGQRVPPGFPVPSLGRPAGVSEGSGGDDGDSAADIGSQRHKNPGAMSGGNYEHAVASVRTLHGAGVTICAGTTANMIPGAEIPFGEGLHEELSLLVETGMTHLEVLRSATCVAAKAFRLSDRGIVRGGLRADLLLVEGNPLEDISATRKIRKIWIQGEDIGPPSTSE
ncbi:amidohydrolase [Colletotrichum truncatum]|uniref:Amidohydrolase n=1 Tax=Colletotrichum truncatum TaxID=5467 RepID=A0ACC3Z0S2_COLTU|nr:amidohydrolase [Colletotrichum truncatum]KAF6800544.1 amidohydrolase [Colletotrichum truncatum]